MTHAVRTRICNFCLAILPAATVFILLLFHRVAPYLKLPVFPRTRFLLLPAT